MAECHSIAGVVAPSTQYRTLSQHPGYRFGDDGSIWTCWNRIPKTVGERVQYRLSSRWLEMHATRNPDGYRLVKVNGKLRKLARLILEAFQGPPPWGMECRHMNGVPHDDRARNLAWGTHKENIDDKLRHGTHQTGERHGCHKLTDDLVRRIRQEYAAGGITQRQLAVKYGVTQGGSIGPLLRGETWRYTT